MRPAGAADSGAVEAGASEAADCDSVAALGAELEVLVEQAAIKIAAAPTRPTRRRCLFIAFWCLLSDQVRPDLSGAGSVCGSAVEVRPPIHAGRSLGTSGSGPGHLLLVARRRASRAADDEPRLEPPVLGLGEIPSFHDGQEQADRLLALATDRLVHRRQRGVHVLGEVDVVEADDADVVGDVEAEVRAAARMAPIAMASLMARTAVGRRPSSQARCRAAIPPSMLAGPTTTRSSGRSSGTSAAANASR